MDRSPLREEEKPPTTVEEKERASSPDQRILVSHESRIKSLKVDKNNSTYQTTIPPHPLYFSKDPFFNTPHPQQLMPSFYSHNLYFQFCQQYGLPLIYQHESLLNTKVWIFFSINIKVFRMCLIFITLRVDMISIVWP